MGTPPSNAGGSHVIVPEYSPTDVQRTFSGGLGTSAEARYRCEGKERRDEMGGAKREGIERCCVRTSNPSLCFDPDSVIPICLSYFYTPL